MIFISTDGPLLGADFFQQSSPTVCCFLGLVITHFIPWRAGTKDETAAVKTVTDRYFFSSSGTKQKIPVSNVKPIICPVAGKRAFTNSACQPLFRRHTPIFQNHGQRYGGSCVHEQTRTRHDRNAKQAVRGGIDFLLAGTGSGSTFSEDVDFFCNFVPRHLEQKRKKYVYFLLEGSFHFNPLSSVATKFK
jgi:hypothetical protein